MSTKGLKLDPATKATVELIIGFSHAVSDESLPMERRIAALESVNALVTGEPKIITSVEVIAFTKEFDGEIPQMEML